MTDDIKNNITKYIPHELRTPLVPIMGLTQLIIEDFDKLSKDELLQMLCNIRTGAIRLKTTIDKLLLYAELEYLFLKQSLSLSSVKYLETAVNILEKVLIEEAEFYNRRNDIIIDILPCRLKIEEEYLANMVKELIDNAFKFSLSETPVLISGKTLECCYEFTIQDYGCGMTPEELNKIGAFVQFNREIWNQDGNGIGLMIVKKISEYFNIQFSIDSAVNDYTKVTLRFPL